MTNQKTTITIDDFEDKKSQNGKRYTRFKTSQGWMSAFEKDIIDALKSEDNEGKTLEVEIAIDEDKGFKNIRKFIGVAKAGSKSFDIDEEVKKLPSKIYNGKDTTTMYVSYAKDIFLKLVELENLKEEKQRMDYGTLMKMSCVLIEQAKMSVESENGRTTDNKQE